MATGILLASFVYTGTAQLDDYFAGLYQADGPVQINRLIISAQVGAVGGNVTVAIVNGSGTELGRVVMLSGSSYQASNLAALVTLQRGDIVRAKIVGVDLGVAGYLTLGVYGATAEYPSGPCCCGPCGSYAGWCY